MFSFPDQSQVFDNALLMNIPKNRQLVCRTDSPITSSSAVQYIHMFRLLLLSIDRSQSPMTQLRSECPPGPCWRPHSSPGHAPPPQGRGGHRVLPGRRPGHGPPAGEARLPEQQVWVQVPMLPMQGREEARVTSTWSESGYLVLSLFVPVILCTTPS